MAMRKVILSVNTTLDGFMAGPKGELDWHFSHWNEKMAEYACEQLSAMDTILVGRVTYEYMAGHWPSASANLISTERDIEFAGLLNNLPKIVFSRTLSTVDWNNSRVVKGNIAREVTRLRNQPGKDMILLGGPAIISTFMRLNLIDEFHIWVSPVILGKGIPLFKDVSDKFNLRLLITKTFSNGVILHCYQRIRQHARQGDILLTGKFKSR
jgi:dihydrofolate reductase